MGVGTALRALGRFLDACEARDVVNRVEISGTENAGASVSAMIELEVDTCANPEETSVSPTDAAVGADGSLSVSFTSTAALIPVEAHNVDLETTCVSSTPDGATVVELRATVPNGDNVPSGDAKRDSARETEDTNTVKQRGEPVEIGDSSVAISVTGGNPDTKNASSSSRDSGGREASTRDTPSSSSDPPSSSSDPPSSSSDPPNSPPSSSSDPPRSEATSTRSRDIPPFRDTELLQEVYDSCETFSEMPEALGMDVTAETARRYMIRQGIHEPTSYNTSAADTDSNANDPEDDATGTDSEADDATGTDSEADDATGTDTEEDTDDDTPADATDSNRPDGDDNDEAEPPTSSPEELESPAVLADGIGLPDDVTIDTIVEAVQKSNTIYEVKQGIGIEREDALEMLRKLNLLEFVAGRLATEAEREVSRGQIIDRLREQADSL